MSLADRGNDDSLKFHMTKIEEGHCLAQRLH